VQLLFFFRSFLSLLPLDNNNEMDRGGEWVTACRPAPGWRPLVRPLAKRSAFHRPICSPLVVIRLAAQRCTPSRRSCANRTLRYHLNTMTDAGLQAQDCVVRPCTPLRAPSQSPQAASPAPHCGGIAVPNRTQAAGSGEQKGSRASTNSSRVPRAEHPFPIAA
jgi:hypothetical protein